MLLHRFHLDKLAFNPSASFVSNLWNCNFFWTLPDTPSGVSIFFCLEMESINASELERERSFALADKVKIRDIEKLSKQRLYIPTSVMDMVWMTQNLSATISLCFGKKIDICILPQGLGGPHVRKSTHLLQSPSFRPGIFCKSFISN